jgi:Fic family protein
MADLMAGTLNTKTVVIEPEMLNIIAELDEFKGAWRALSTLAPERLSALRRVATIESIGSSTRIEGSKLSDQDVEKMLSNVEVRSFETRDEQEVAGYADVMETIFASWSVLPLTENHVRQLHRDLLRYSTKDERHRGKYKKLDNHVEAFDANGKSVGIVFQTASPFDTPRLMTELIEWTTEALSNRTLHPLLVIAVFIVVFLEIHPFQDGNGRLSRVLTTLLLLRAGYAYVPYSSLESVIEQSKESYDLALRRTQKTTRSKEPDWQPWIMVFPARTPAAQKPAGIQG